MKKRLVTLANLALNALYGRNITIVTPEGKYYLKTTVGHPLKRYLRKFDKYDRFLPYLSKAHPGKSLIDIGANIGDTLVLVKSVSAARVICVEPDPQFLSYLKENVKINGLTSVVLYPYPISSEKKVVAVEKYGVKATSNMSEVSKKNTKHGIETKSFQELITELSLDINSIGIIKSDTDGYDWDCLNSIADYFDSAENINYPEFIFYEHQAYLNRFGRKDPHSLLRERKYQKALTRLWDHQYTLFYIFDNFGNLIHRVTDLEELFSITMSLSSHELRKSNYFVDVLITDPSKEFIVKQALALQAEKQMFVD